MVFVLWNGGFKDCSGGERMMIRLTTIFLFSFVFVNCTNRKLTKKEIEAANQCRTTWQYLNLKDTITGEVLYHAKASFGCGVLASASSTIIKTALNDTMRILWLCNEEMNFSKFEIITYQKKHQKLLNGRPVTKVIKGLTCLNKKISSLPQFLVVHTYSATLCYTENKIHLHITLP